jgi:hypothetical protein
MRILIALCLLSISPRIDKPRKELPKATQIKDGWYSCEGETPGGKQYHSVVTVRHIKEVYIINWIDEDSIISGIGVLEKNKLYVSYSQLNEKQLIHGIEILEVDGDTLTGVWTMHPGDGEMHPEKWIFLRSLPKQKSKEPDTE